MAPIIITTRLIKWPSLVMQVYEPFSNLKNVHVDSIRMNVTRSFGRAVYRLASIGTGQHGGGFN